MDTAMLQAMTAGMTTPVSGSYRAGTNAASLLGNTGGDFLSVLSQLSAGGLSGGITQSSTVTGSSGDLIGMLTQLLQGMMQSPVSDALATEVADASALLGISATDSDTSTVDLLMKLLQARQDETDTAAPQNSLAAILMQSLTGSGSTDSLLAGLSANPTLLSDTATVTPLLSGEMLRSAVAISATSRLPQTQLSADVQQQTPTANADAPVLTAQPQVSADVPQMNPTVHADAPVLTAQPQASADVQQTLRTVHPDAPVTAAQQPIPAAPQRVTPTFPAVTPTDTAQVQTVPADASFAAGISTEVLPTEAMPQTTTAPAEAAVPTRREEASAAKRTDEPDDPDQLLALLAAAMEQGSGFAVQNFGVSTEELTDISAFGSPDEPLFAQATPTVQATRRPQSRSTDTTSPEQLSTELMQTAGAAAQQPPFVAAETIVSRVEAQPGAIPADVPLAMPAQTKVPASATFAMPAQTEVPTGTTFAMPAQTEVSTGTTFAMPAQTEVSADATFAMPAQTEVSASAAFAMPAQTEVPASATFAGSAQTEVPAGATFVMPAQTSSQPQSAEEQLVTQTFGEAALSRMVRATRQTLTDEAAPETAPETAAAAIAPQTLSNPAEQANAVLPAPTAAPEEAASIYSQTLDALQNRAAQAEDSFTVKLTPDGLGEITVELTKSAEGKVMLSLAASSSKTAEVLTSQLGVLQTALGPDTEILAVTVEKSDAGMFYQSFQEQNPGQTGGQQQGYHASRAWNAQTTEETAEAEAMTAIGAAPANGSLHTYI